MAGKNHPFTTLFLLPQDSEALNVTGGLFEDNCSNMVILLYTKSCKPSDSCNLRTLPRLLGWWPSSAFRGDGGGSLWHREALLPRDGYTRCLLAPAGFHTKNPFGTTHTLKHQKPFTPGALNTRSLSCQSPVDTLHQKCVQTTSSFTPEALFNLICTKALYTTSRVQSTKRIHAVLTTLNKTQQDYEHVAPLTVFRLRAVFFHAFPTWNFRTKACYLHGLRSKSSSRGKMYAYIWQRYPNILAVCINPKYCNIL